MLDHLVESPAKVGYVKFVLEAMLLVKATINRRQRQFRS